jgi:hypothetical protein
MLEASLDTLNEGQLLLERIKDLGSFTESINQHSTVAACYEVEHLLGIHQDERHQIEDEWDRNRKLLYEYVQMSTVRHDIDQVGSNARDDVHERQQTISTCDLDFIS